MTWIGDHCEFEEEPTTAEPGERPVTVFIGAGTNAVAAVQFVESNGTLVGIHHSNSYVFYHLWKNTHSKHQ